MGIDCIQVIIPKDSPENIEKVFEKTNRTKWIYNNEQESREYIPVSLSGGEGISFIDEDQRKFFEESFKCRMSQVGNLIRTINRCVGAEQFREIVENLRSEISRVTRNSELARENIERTRSENAQRIEQFRDRIRTEVNLRHQTDIDRIHSERKRVEAEELQLQEFIEQEENEFRSRVEDYKNRVEEELSKQYPITLDEKQ